MPAFSTRLLVNLFAAVGGADVQVKVQGLLVLVVLFFVLVKGVRFRIGRFIVVLGPWLLCRLPFRVTKVQTMATGTERKNNDIEIDTDNDNTLLSTNTEDFLLAIWQVKCRQWIKATYTPKMCAKQPINRDSRLVYCP